MKIKKTIEPFKTSLSEKRGMFLFKNIACLIVCCVSFTAFSQAGILDNSFGNGGIVTASIAPQLNRGTGLIIKPDGRMVLGGYCGYGDSIALLGYNTDGSVDNAFGINGVVTSTSCNYLNGMVLQPDGKIVITGGMFSTMRFLSDGNIDSSFGINGVVTTSITGGQSRCLTLQSDGKVIVAGNTNFSSGDFIIIRYNSNGSLDNSFGNNGIVTTAVGNPTSIACHAIALQSDGKILVGGRNNNVLIVRYNSDGTIDNSFGININGIVTHTIGSGLELKVQQDDKIIMSVSTITSTSGTALRFNSNGIIDNSFGNNGIAVVTPSLRPVSSYIQPDNKILIAGWMGSLGVGSLTLVRYNNDGSMDNSFGTNGVAINDIKPGFDIAKAITMQPGGKIIVAGDTQEPGMLHFLLARYESGLFVGIDEVSKSEKEIIVSPNPFKDKINIEVKGIEEYKVEITDNIGRLVYEKKIFNSKQQINISFLPEGVYILRLFNSNKQIYTQKLIKNGN